MKWLPCVIAQFELLTSVALINRLFIPAGSPSLCSGCVDVLVEGRLQIAEISVYITGGSTFIAVINIWKYILGATVLKKNICRKLH